MRQIQLAGLQRSWNAFKPVAMRHALQLWECFEQPPTHTHTHSYVECMWLYLLHSYFNYAEYVTLIIRIYGVADAFEGPKQCTRNSSLLYDEQPLSLLLLLLLSSVCDRFVCVCVSGINWNLFLYVSCTQDASGNRYLPSPSVHPSVCAACILRQLKLNLTKRDISN